MCFSGCASKFAEDTLPEKKLNSVQTYTKVPIRIKDFTIQKVTYEELKKLYPDWSEEWYESNLKAQDEYGPTSPVFPEDVEFQEYDHAFKIAFKKSQYFTVLNDSNVPFTIEIEKPLKLKQRDFSFLNGLGAFFGVLTLAILPTPRRPYANEIVFKVYDSKSKLLKQYTYEETTVGVFTSYTPFALFVGSTDETYTKTIADKFVSNLIVDLEKDGILKYRDSNKI